MNHLILGYGYCGFYLAQELLKQGQPVTAISRHLNKDWDLPGLIHVTHDLEQPLNWTKPDTIIYYLIPPPSQGERDTFLEQFLSHSQINAKKVIYFGSSSVYGNHQGAWVNEQSVCLVTNSRQKRRLDAEEQWLTYCQRFSIEPILLRIAGIYGPHRLPIDAAKSQTPIIEKNKAPYTNLIYVKDLAAISYLLTQSSSDQVLYNIADGEPQPMGTSQQKIAEILGIPAAPEVSFSQIWENASPMKHEFMESSKRLSIETLKATLGANLFLTPLNDAIKQNI